MNQTIAIPLLTSHDVRVNEASSDISLDALGLGDTASKRRIRFASTVSEVAGRVLSRDDLSEDEKKDYWMEREEFLRNQSKAKITVMAVKKHGSAYVHYMDDAYKIAQHLSEFMVEENAIDLFFEDPSCYTKKMEMWADADYGQRGLERYISPLQKSQRGLETRETRRMVLIAANKGLGDDELADLYAALSWTTCILSRMLGHADYVAAHFAEDAAPEQLKHVQMPPLKNEHHSEPCIRNLKEEQVVPNQDLKLLTPSQDRRILKQGHVSQGTLVSRAA
jgi:hypothetical protein